MSASGEERQMPRSSGVSERFTRVAENLKQLMNQESIVTINSAASGEVLDDMDAEDFRDMEKTYGKTVRALKRWLAERLGVTRFRQRIMMEDSSEVLSDDFELTPPLDLQLVILDYLPKDTSMEKAFFLACADNHLDEVERMLQQPQDPNEKGCIYGKGLQAAEINQNLECIELLKEAGAKVHPGDPVFNRPGWMTPKHVRTVSGLRLWRT